QRHPALDRYCAMVQRRSAVDLAVAGDVDLAGAARTAVIDGAAVDGGVALKSERRAVVDLDDRAARGVGEGGAVHRDVVERQNDSTLDRHPANVDNSGGCDGAVDRTVGGDVNRAAARNGAAVDGGAVQLQPADVVDLNNAACIGDGNFDIERASGDLDRPGIRDAAGTLEIAALVERDEAARIVQNAAAKDLRLAQQRGDGADAEGSEILQDRIGVQAQPAVTDRQAGTLCDVQFRTQGRRCVVVEVVQGHGVGRGHFTSLDRDRIEWRLPNQ